MELQSCSATKIKFVAGTDIGFSWQNRNLELTIFRDIIAYFVMNTSNQNFLACLFKNTNRKILIIKDKNHDLKRNILKWE